MTNTEVTHQPGTHDLTLGEVRKTETGETRWFTAYNIPATVHEARVIETTVADNYGWAKTYTSVATVCGTWTGLHVERTHGTEAEAVADARRYEASCAAREAREAAEWAAMTNAEQCASMGYGIGRYNGD